MNDKPEKFEVNKWIEWEENMIDYLSSIYNNRKVTLRYVARKDYPGNVTDMTREEETLYHTSLNVPMFDQDYNKVIRIIKELTIGTTSET